MCLPAGSSSFLLISVFPQFPLFFSLLLLLLFSCLVKSDSL